MRTLIVELVALRNAIQQKKNVTQPKNAILRKSVTAKKLKSPNAVRLTKSNLVLFLVTAQNVM